MWSPFYPLLSLATGFINHFQQSLDINNSGVIYLPESHLHGRRTAAQPRPTGGSVALDELVVAAKEACRAVPDFVSNFTGGDGGDIQFYYVGYWPTQSTVVVAHQGTDPSHILAIRTDMDFFFKRPDPTLFPGIPKNVEVHGGFAKEHKKTASIILAEVKRLMSEHSSTSVILIGHSLGGALAELDTLFMKLNLPSGTTVRGITFGTPRVGNVAWAAFFDSQVSMFTRMNNKLDPVPTMPGQGLGFRHPKVEIHIGSDRTVVICPGDDDDTDPECSDKLVPEVEDGDIGDHDGPYHGIHMGTLACTP
ncbi:Alpha/Beta hydrolase protein [Lactifluus subvellereus]|nr:Alpha/Beta hydrolase protein [Lactifluus subvellereus]